MTVALGVSFTGSYRRRRSKLEEPGWDGVLSRVARVAIGVERCCEGAGTVAEMLAAELSMREGGMLIDVAVGKEGCHERLPTTNLIAPVQTMPCHGRYSKIK